MYYTVKNLKEHGSSETDNVAYSAELYSPMGEIIYAELSPDVHGAIAYNSQTGNIYPVVGIVEQKPLLELKDNDMIVLGECIEKSK